MTSLAGALILGSCGGGGTAEGGSAEAAEVEVFSWWTGGGEAAGLDAMIEDFQGKHPGITFNNAAVAGGAGTNAKAVLASRLQAGDPPDSFQGHAGAELLDYITADQLEPVTFLYEEEGWHEVFPDQLIEQITHQGEIYSVPVNIHRANMVWFNPDVLSEAGIDAPPATMEEWFAALDKAEAAGVIPLALGEQWTVKHLLETVLLADLGTQAYEGLWDGSTDWSAPQVTRALEDFARLLSYTNSDAASLTWQDASKLVVDGEAAFNVMGDWAAGYFKELGHEPETDYGYLPVPGTDGVYQWLSDSFTLPKDAPHREAAIEWLKECGSKSGQDAFNPVKGSIPARSDADTSLYGPYLQWALEEWNAAETELAGSLTHGVVANNAWNTAIDTAIGLFLQNEDVGKLQEALATAADEHAQG